MTLPNTSTRAAPPPSSFLGYLRSFGPGLVVVLTWLGAGDVVDMAVAGGNYGYALMWVLVLAVFMRFLFVSLIAKYQLCNQHGEGVLDGLVRLHRWYAPALFAAAVIMGHVYGSYMTVGCGEACRNTFRVGETWHWALLCNGVAVGLVLLPSYLWLENLFKVFLAVLSIAFLGAALWVGPDPDGIVQGLYRFEMPKAAGDFNPLLVSVAMIGAIGGSLMNLAYPYFLEAKGWRGPAYRRVQLYDFLLAMVVMVVLNLAVWTLGAELLYPDKRIAEMDDLPRLLSEVLGENGRVLFYVGIFAAIFTSLIGHAVGLACMGSHAFARWKVAGTLRVPPAHGTLEACPTTTNGTQSVPDTFRSTRLYCSIAVWCLVSPLIWTVPGLPGFVQLTLVANAAQVLLLPVLAGGLWWITASARYIGPAYRNRLWENLVMAFLFALALYGAVGSFKSVRGFVLQGFQ